MPELVSDWLFTKRSIAELNSPEFSRLFTSARVKDFAKEEMMPDESLLKLVAEIFRSSFARILFELVIDDALVIERLLAEISPEFVRLLAVSCWLLVEEINPEFVSIPPRIIA